MITRHKSINPKSREIQFSLSFGSADVARLVKADLRCFYEDHDQIPDYDWRSRANGYPYTEADFIEVFSHVSMPTSVLPEKLRFEIAKWAFAQAVALGYVAEQVSTPGVFYFSKKGLDLMKKKQNDT